RVASIFNYAPDGSVNSMFLYAYDALGRRTSMETSDGTWTYTYDLTGQLTRAVFASINPQIPSQDLNYVYDALGNRIRTVLNGAPTPPLTQPPPTHNPTPTTTPSPPASAATIPPTPPSPPNPPPPPANTPTTP